MVINLFVISEICFETFIHNNMNKMKQFVCNTCGRSYTQKYNLTRHQQYECGVLGIFGCELCAFRSKRKCSLQSHMKKIHKL